MTTALVYDSRSCELGEGPLWHPVRKQLFQFDIEGHQLLWQTVEGEPQALKFDGPVSAAGWIDREHLLVASHRALHRVEIDSGQIEDLVPLESDNPATRSNDGRTDMQGGFWIGTMGCNGASEAGALYRYANGELRKLRAKLTTPNAICFAPDGTLGYFADTRQRRVWSWALDKQGWPVGSPNVFLDLSQEGLRPDGAVTDAAGNLWIAQWAESRVAVYAPDGQFLSAHPLPTAHTSCPAFGGPDFRDLYVTSARQKLMPEDLANQPDAGRTFVLPRVGAGRAEPQVILP